MKVETYTTEWTPQAEMAYDGLGNRLEMTGFADATRYVYDGGNVLAATAGELETVTLYGLGVIGEWTTGWSYALLDGSRTARQQVDASGAVTLTLTYMPHLLGMQARCFMRHHLLAQMIFGAC